MQIEVDFDVFKALTVLRRGEEDTCNNVIRRLLKLADDDGRTPEATDMILSYKNNVSSLAKAVLGSQVDDGAWIGNVFFPNGTRFRATYKGQTYRASIKGERWVGEDGIARQSPSEAACAISGTNVNGWRFWYGIRPLDDDWRRLDEFRK